MSWSRLHLLPSALLALSACIFPTIAELDSRDTIPAPYIFPSDTDWVGIDGNWSSFTLEVGTPAQSVQTLISWSSYQTWVVIPEGCQTATDYTACAQARGGIFQYNKSSTFHKIGFYALAIDENLGLFSNAIYGYDQVSLAGQGLTLSNTTVAGMALDTFYTGVFGINPRPTNFTSINDPSPSYMTQLKQQNKIPSVSFGFTAGARYRSSAGVNASLTLGGYDTSKFDANNVTFNFGSDTDHEIMVALQSISTASKITSSPNQVQLLPSPIFIEIDTTVSHIYLPIQACQLFESEFGLTYDNETNLYLVNDTLHNSLLSRNPNITFTIGQMISGGQNVHITLPYAAFDLTAKAGYQGLSSDTNYFPLKRAQNSTQYVLGRTFMQEAYITVDYEVSRFQLAQAVFDQTSQHIVAIPAANTSQSSDSWTSSTYKPSYSSASTSTSSTQNNGLSTGAIVGIVVGVVVGLIVAAIVAWLVVRRQRRKQTAAQVMESDNGFPSDGKDRSHVFPKAELAGSDPAEFGLTHHDIDRKALLGSHPPSSAGTAHSPGSYLNPDGTMSSQHSGFPLTPITPLSEAHSRAIYEMPGDIPETLKDGRELGEKEALQHRERIYNGIDETVDGSSSSAEEIAREPRRVAAEDVVNAQTGDHLGRHRAFSFEFDRSETENLTDGSGRTLVNSQTSGSDNASEQREGRTLI